MDVDADTTLFSKLIDNHSDTLHHPSHSRLHSPQSHTILKAVYIQDTISHLAVISIILFLFFN